MNSELNDKIMSLWQRLAEKKDPEIDMKDDSNHRFLFHNFLDEDIDEAWSLVPNNQEIRKRVDLLEESCASLEEIGCYTAYSLPSSKHKIENSAVINLVKSYFDNIRPLIEDYEYHDGLAEIQKGSLNYEFIDADNNPFENCEDWRICELEEAIADKYYGLLPSFDVCYALNRMALYTTMDDSIKRFLMSPLLQEGKSINSETFTPGFLIFKYSVGFRIKDDSTIICTKFTDE